MSRKFQHPWQSKGQSRGHSVGPLNESMPIELSLPKRSFWRDRTRQVWSFFCPLCKVPRRIPYQPRPGLMHLFQMGLTSVVLMLATWKWFEWKGIVSFFPLWALFEMIYRSKVRASLACIHCGFDPYLYLIDVPRAREVVENHWRKKFAEKGIPYPEPEKKTRGASFTSNTSKVTAAKSASGPASGEAQPSTKSKPPEMVT